MHGTRDVVLNCNDEGMYDSGTFTSFNIVKHFITKKD